MSHVDRQSHCVLVAWGVHRPSGRTAHPARPARFRARPRRRRAIVGGYGEAEREGASAASGCGGGGAGPEVPEGGSERGGGGGWGAEGRSEPFEGSHARCLECRFLHREKSMGRQHTAQLRVGRVLAVALCAIAVGGLFLGCHSSGLGQKGSTTPDGSSDFDAGTGGASGTGKGGATVTSGSGGAASNGGVTGNGGVIGLGGIGRSGGITGGTTGAAGTTAASPADAGFDQAVDAPQADARQGGAGGSGGTTAEGGFTRTGGATGTAGTTALSAADAGLDGQADGAIDVKSADALLGTDSASNSCENPLPLQCGDRLYHNTLIQGRPNVLGFYGCSQRVMSGPETIYFLAPPTGCQTVVQLKNLSADLVLFVLPTCSFMSSCSFRPEVGQPSFVVVDGANGAWGTYTLQVDCTCNQDGGTSDLPDAQEGTATAPGCDLDVAWKAIAAAGLAAVGTPQTLGVTLPATLATDANWGLKATVCQQGGYDITALAGKPICLLEQDITQRCQGNPASVSVLMNNGAVACIYKTVRKGFGTPPGVYSATSPNCMQPTLAAGTSVSCGRSSCASPWPCCPRLTTVNVAESCGLRCPAPITCDGPNDCPNGNVCCSLESAAAGFLGTSCLDASECVAPSRVICGQQADCPSPQQCAVPNPMPAYTPENYSPTLPPYSWMVDFKVCSP